MKLAVVGSRSFNNYSLLRDKLSIYSIREIVSGGARGADSLGERYAKETGIPVKLFIPEWSKYGRSAGVMRNKDIVEYCDELIAFWDGTSKGTQNTISVCKRLNKPYTVIYY